jgi:hypothetical protein
MLQAGWRELKMISVALQICDAGWNAFCILSARPSKEPGKAGDDSGWRWLAQPGPQEGL